MQKALTQRSSRHLTAHATDLAKTLVHELGDRTLVFIDAGPAIDAEHYASNYRHDYRDLAAPQFFQTLDTHPGLKLCTTDLVFRELVKHHLQHTYHGRPEISKDLLALMSTYHKRWETYNLCAQPQEDTDSVRYDVYWGSHAALKDHPKKHELDPISITDRDLVTQSLLAASHVYHPESAPFESSRRLTGVAVLTTDLHVSSAVKALTYCPYGSAHTVLGGRPYHGTKTYDPCISS